MSQPPSGEYIAGSGLHATRDAPHELAYRLRQQELVSEFGLFALRSPIIADLFQEATRIAASGLDVKLCKLLRYLPEEKMLLLVAGVGWKEGVVGNTRLGADLESPAGYAFRTGQPLISNHLGKEDRFRTPPLLREHGVTRALNVPVRDSGRAFGVLEVDSPDTTRFTIADTAFLQAVANIVSAAFERWKAEQNLELLAREQKHRVKNLFTVAGALLRISERDAVREGRSPIGLAQKRLAALARASSLSMGATAETEGRTDAFRLTRLILAPYEGSYRLRGEEIALLPDQVSPIALMLHEFATNAVKYGGFSTDVGEVQIGWIRKDGKTCLVWEERGAAVTPADGTGFGGTLVSSVAGQLGADIAREWREDGLHIAVCF